MPLYEYQCQQCHRLTEKIQKFSDAPLITCPHCGGHLERTLTAPAVQFKGAGWYKDLYSSAKPASAGSNAGEGGSSNDKTSTAAPADKPAAAAPAPAAPSTSSPTGNAGSGS